MTADAQQRPGEVNILHRGVGAFILIVLVLILLKGLLREQRVPVTSVEDFAAAVALPVPDTGYQSTVQLGQTRRVINSIRVPVKIGGNLKQSDSTTVASKPANKRKPAAPATGKSPAKVVVAAKKTVKKRAKPIRKKAVAHAVTPPANKRKSRASNTKKSVKAVAKARVLSKKIPRPSITKPSTVKRNTATVKIAKARSSVRAGPATRVVARSNKNLRAMTKSRIPADWIVQIGLYSSDANARRVKADLRKLGYPVVSMPMKTGKGIVTRLWLGPYKKRSSAALVRKKIMVLARYKDSFIASNPLQRK